MNRQNQLQPRLVSHISEVIGFYSLLWDAYVTKEAHNQRLQMENKELRYTNAHLIQQQVIIERRDAKQDALLVNLRREIGRVRESVMTLLENRNGFSWESSEEQVYEADS